MVVALATGMGMVVVGKQQACHGGRCFTVKVQWPRAQLDRCCQALQQEDGYQIADKNKQQLGPLRAVALGAGGGGAHLQTIQQPVYAATPSSDVTTAKSRQRFRAFNASLMPSLTPTSVGKAFSAACASRSL